jgi:hypothetical protein
VIYDSPRRRLAPSITEAAKSSRSAVVKVAREGSCSLGLNLTVTAIYQV